MYLNLKLILENSVFQNVICYYIFRKFCFFSRSTDNLFTVITDRIDRELNTSGAYHAVILDISNAFYRVWHTRLFTNLSYVML